MAVTLPLYHIFGTHLCLHPSSQRDAMLHGPPVPIASLSPAPTEFYVDPPTTMLGMVSQVCLQICHLNSSTPVRISKAQGATRRPRLPSESEKIFYHIFFGSKYRHAMCCPTHFSSSSKLFRRRRNGAETPGPWHQRCIGLGRVDSVPDAS